MVILHTITKYTTIFFIMLVVMALIVGAIAYYLLKVKKIASKEEQFDYSKFDRKDSVDYVRFDQIINTTENGITTKNGLIVLNDGFRYIAGLKVNGYNFFSASAQEQHQSMQGMVSFLNAVEGDIQYRQSTKAIDLSENIEKHKKRLKEVETELYGLQMDHEELCESAEAYLDDPQIYYNYDKRITELERTIKCKEHTQQELDVVIQYMEALSGRNLEAEKVQCWLFDWNYNANDYTEELNDEEKYAKAAAALSTKANSYIAALQRTGCTCERMSAEEILELFRYHFSPITADAYKITDLYDSSINALYVTSDSLDTLKREDEEERTYFDILNQQRIEREEIKKIKEMENTLVMDSKDSSSIGGKVATEPSVEIPKPIGDEFLSLSDQFSFAPDESGTDENEEMFIALDQDSDDEQVVFEGLQETSTSDNSALEDNTQVKKSQRSRRKTDEDLFEGQQTIFGNDI